MNSVKITIPGQPVAFARSGGNGKIRFTPKRQRDFMCLVRMAGAEAMRGREPMQGALEVSISSVAPIPASWPKKRAADAIWRTSRPDADNIAKIVADALNMVVWQDDAQIAVLIVEKLYGPVASTIISAVKLEGGGHD